MTEPADNRSRRYNRTIARPPLPPPPRGRDADTDVRVAEAREALQGRRSDTLASGDLVGDRYRIERILGEGGMATVYLARHIEIGAPIAIKVLHRVLSYVPEIADRFLAEARAVSKVHNPHVVQVSDYGKLEDGTPWMAMEYLQGQDLASCLQECGPLPWRRVRSIVLQVCEALQAVHEAGIVHCDVKPHNCVRQAEGSLEDFIKLLDFGIARVPDDDDERLRNRVIGTPDYMSPEQATGSAVDPRTDVYGLGIMAFVLLTGRTPFDADDPSEIMAAHVGEEPPAPSDIVPDLDPAIDELLRRALAKAPADRFASMVEMAEAVRAIPETPLLDQAAPSQDETSPNRRSWASSLKGRHWAIGLFAGMAAALIIPVGSLGAKEPVRLTRGMNGLAAVRPAAPGRLANAVQFRVERDRLDPSDPVPIAEGVAEPSNEASADEPAPSEASAPKRTRRRKPATRPERKESRRDKRSANGGRGSWSIEPIKNPFE